MDLGLYNLKYPFRRMISWALPLCRNVSPNAISWALLPVGLATAGAYYWGAQGHTWLYLVGMGLIFLRMFMGTLDGLVAVHFDKASPKGELVNRITPELCDVMVMAALALARPEWALAGVAALAMAWLTSFAGLLGAVVGLKGQSVGPVGQTDRLVALQAMSLAAFLGAQFDWGVDFLLIFLWWCAGGGVLTVFLRLWRHVRAAARLDPAAEEGSGR